MRRRLSKGILSVVFLGLSAWVCACGQSVEQGHGDGGAEIKVSYGTDSQTVKLDDVTPATVEGVSGAKLADVITKAFPSITLAEIGADFVASDGFRPSKKNSCRILIPLAQATLEKGVLDPTSGNLLWAPSLGFGGCLQVKGVVEVYVVNLADTGPKFEVRLAQNTVAVDLRFQPTADFGGEQRIPLQGLITAAGATDSPQTFNYDFQDASGHSPGADDGATLLTWDQVASLSLGPTSRDLKADAAAGLPIAWTMSEAQAVILNETTQATKKVLVVLGDSQVEVDLGTLATVTVGSEQLVLMQTVVSAAALVADPSTQHFDLEGVDGYRPTIDRSAPPLTWEQLGKAYLNPYSRNASFDASLGLAGYWSVSDVAKLHLVDSVTPTKKVKVVLDTTEKEVDLNTLATVDVGGTQLVVLQTVITASGIMADATTQHFDLEGSDGFRPTVDKSATPLDWTQIGSGYLDPTSADASFDASLGLAGYWSVSDVVKIHLVDVMATKSVTVVLGTDEVPVDLGTLATVDVGGLQLATLQTVVGASALLNDGTLYTYDLEGADGFRPTVDKGAASLTWEQIGQGYVRPITADASFDPSLGLAKYWSVKGVAKVHLLPK